MRIRIAIGSARYPSAEEFVRREAASSPLAGPLGGLRPEVRQALIDDLRAMLGDRTDDEGVTFPMETFLATARR